MPNFDHLAARAPFGVFSGSRYQPATVVALFLRTLDHSVSLAIEIGADLATTTSLNPLLEHRLHAAMLLACNVHVNWFLLTTKSDDGEYFEAEVASKFSVLDHQIKRALLRAADLQAEARREKREALELVAQESSSNGEDAMEVNGVSVGEVPNLQTPKALDTPEDTEQPEYAAFVNFPEFRALRLDGPQDSEYGGTQKEEEGDDSMFLDNEDYMSDSETSREIMMQFE
ncbi:hypothetical protein EDC01DRAFT_777616 [Geopyxis carbonaria]|nr:hypothetical protein EDC01DRAFT_777616 [Geopyxis carbonaria]